LIYQDFNKRTHLRSVVINQSVIEAPQDLCIRLTRSAWDCRLDARRRVEARDAERGHGQKLSYVRRVALLRRDWGYLCVIRI